MAKKKPHNSARKKTQALKPLPTKGAKEELYRGREVVRDLIKGFVMIMVVLAIKVAIEHTSFGKHLELMSYNLLQTQLSSEPPAITIVDISDLKRKDFIVNGEVVTATPREEIKAMIEAIAQQNPKAIGVDIDFSPDEGGYILPRDPDFFQFCLDLQEENGIPVFLGVKRTLAKPASDWLGSERFESLAANILIPKDNKRMLELLEFQENDVRPPPLAHHTSSRSLSALVAEAYGEDSSANTLVQRIDRSLISSFSENGLLEKFSERQIGGGLSVRDFLIDYSPLDSIEIVPTIDSNVLRDSSHRKHLEDKIVLIGDATLGKATDTFVIPSRTQPYPGVMVHACAAYTLIKAPLYELTGKGHLLIDIALSGVILLAIVLLGFRYKSAQVREVSTNKWRGLFTLLIVVSSIIVGVIFVRYTRIMWDDFFLALVLLIFHPSIEDHAESLWNKIRSKSTPKTGITE